ncbi:hypothetical protein [Aquipseudomonas guryensis]|jgi:hypothetical protein|uniref:Uncharacterized protein n=1 Tax=Aquipseudomonas guryensis TaxID=2759165 RepID=A0A7W4H3P9_9GAMM|nr:hypothetical protein [Pseudomonas guryensis]MBB1519684.1 hypothetical protein [Pseudomonas guryensis]
MNRRILLLLALLLPLSACTVYPGYGGYGGHPRHTPPPYGDWRWDDDLDVYVSIGYPRLYFRDRIYYRWDDHGWYSGDDYRGPWKPHGYQGIPPGLSREHPYSANQGGHGSGHERDKWGDQQGQQGQGQYRSQQGGGSKSSSQNYEHGQSTQGQGQGKSSNKGGKSQKKQHDSHY